jgi:hypothetical protein
MGSTVDNTGVLVAIDSSYNPDQVPANKNCYFFDPISGNVTFSDDANCDQTFVPQGSDTSKQVKNLTDPSK